MTEDAIHLQNLHFSYHGKNPVLEIPALKIKRGDHAFLYGPSGSGKTTLLGILAGILSPQQGQVSILGQNLSQMSARARDHFRGSHLGYIFQMFNLIPYLDVQSNITLPCRMVPARKARVPDIEQTTRRLANGLGIGHLLNKPVTELSVGQQQRVAAARALMGAPEIIIADEPTSALDYDHRQAFIEVLFEQADLTNSTILFVSHDKTLASLFSSQISLSTLNRAKGGATS